MKGKLKFYFDEPACEGMYYFVLPEGVEDKLENYESFPDLAHNKFVTITGPCLTYFAQRYDIDEADECCVPNTIDKRLWLALFDCEADVEIQD